MHCKKVKQDMSFKWYLKYQILLNFSHPYPIVCLTPTIYDFGHAVCGEHRLTHTVREKQVLADAVLITIDSSVCTTSTQQKWIDFIITSPKWHFLPRIRKFYMMDVGVEGCDTFKAVNIREINFVSL